MPAYLPATDGPWPSDYRQIRWGLYLRPDARTCRDQAGIHELLTRQYGLRAGGSFMPHATVKGFFLSPSSEDDLIAALEPVLSRAVPFPVHNAGPVRFGPATVVLDIQRQADGSNNDAFTTFHTACLEALIPHIDPNCPNTPREGVRDRFHGHLTLSMADCPPWLGDEVAQFIDDLRPIGSPDFTARHIHLFAFTSADWGGQWWDTLRWRLCHAWTLA